jgi:hypothetical protein
MMAGEDRARSEALTGMTTSRRSHRGSSPLDDLTEELLECGALLSQIISHMVQFEAAGKSAPDAVPIPQMAHRLIRDVIDGLARKHSAKEIRAAAAIVGEATKVIGDEVLLVSPDMN